MTVKLLIAGGKTGGHLFPGIAVAQAVRRRHPDTRILFVGTRAPFEVSTLKTYGYAHRAILAKPIKGGGVWKKAYGLSMILVSLLQSLFILLRFRPDFVLGVGGFSSFAVVLAAWILRIPTALHEQNALPGITNRMLVRFVDRIFTTFESTRGMADNPKTRCVGNPIREAGPIEDGDVPWMAEITPQDFVLLVTGGSQGAASINRAVSDAMSEMGQTPDFFLIHQTGPKDESEVRKIYKDRGIRSRVQAFFHNMPSLQERADLVIARAGAGTITELCVKGLPAILVPFPFAADDHQAHNARNLVDREAAIMVADSALSGKGLYEIIRTLKLDSERREQMAAAMRQQAKPDAADRIATHILTQQASKD